MTREELALEQAKIAKELTTAIWEDRNHGLLANLRHDGKIPSGASPMADFEEVYAEVKRITQLT